MVNRSIFILVYLWLFGLVSAYANTEVLALKSSIYENERNLRILLPEGYDPNRSEPYPVLYMNDGQNLYSTDDSMTGEEWQMDEILPSMIETGSIEPMIVVGIDTPSYADRANEYLPWPDEYLTPYIEEPKGSSYPEFLEQEVLPLIEQNYNVGKSARYRSLGGSSYGGLITLYTAVSSELFSKYLIESPSLYVNKGAIFKLLRRRSVKADKIYMGIGTHEGLTSCDQAANEEPVDDLRRAVELMRGNFKLYDEVEECGLHSEIDWARRLPTTLIHLFAD